MEDKKIRVAITQGDTNGIGLEVIMKAFEDPTMLELCTPIIYGSPKVAAYHCKALNLQTQFSIIAQATEAREGRLNLLTVFDEEVKIDFGLPTEEAGQAAKLALDRAIDDYRAGLFDVLVTAPVNKNSIPGFVNHTHYLEKAFGTQQQGLSILMAEDLRVALVTNNLAIKDIAESITKQKIVEKAKLFHQSLLRDLRIANPRIAVLALNPHAGDDGQLGEEEHDIIAPAIAELEEHGIQAFGPYAADDFFGAQDYYRFDGVLAMYHDQGLTPFKTIAAEEGIRFSAGLPLVHTAPAHGTCYELAGKGKADPHAMLQAIFAAIDIARHRVEYDEPLQNPLPKLYHEKRDDSEKVRFRSQNKKEPTAEKEQE